MTPSTVPDTSADPAADETGPLRAAVHALTMHATVHAGIADWERGLHDGSPPTTVADELHALVAAQAPRHQAIADAAHQLAAALTAVVDGLDQTRTTRTHELTRHDAAGPSVLTALYGHARAQLYAHRRLLPELHAVLDNLPLDHPDPST